MIDPQTGQKLTPKQAKFVREYLIDLNATQAAIRAGYSKRTAKEQGYGNLIKPHIQAALVELREQLKNTLNVDAAQVIREFCRVGFANMQDYTRVRQDGRPEVDLSDLTEDQWAALSEVSTHTTVGKYGESERVTVRCHSKSDALDKLARHLGLYKADNDQSSAKEQILEFLGWLKDRNGPTSNDA